MSGAVLWLPALDNIMKWLVVRAIPTATTLWNAVLPVARDPRAADDWALLRAWKYAAAANLMQRRGVEPRALRRSQHAVLSQCGQRGYLDALAAEVRRRGLTYGVDLSEMGTAGKAHHA